MAPKVSAGTTYRPRKKHHFLLWLLLIIVCAGTAAVVAASAYWLRDLPTLNGIEKYGYSQTTTVYASDNKTVLAEFYLQNRQPVKLAEISGNVIQATLATEDERFYDHGAVDVIGIGRALWNNVSARLFGTDSGLQGASTITQQLVRNTVLSEEATDISVKRKLREARLALDLEEVYTKDQILNMYLNTINYGDNCYGIQAAAKHYFSKNASDLSVLQAATLAGIPQSPNAFTPTIDPDACKERRNLVLDRMAECGYISEKNAEKLKKKKLKLKVAPAKSSDGIYAYPYFTSYVRDTLVNEYSTSEIFEGGLSVYTTLDIRLQKAAESACNSQLEMLDPQIEAALVSIDPDTGFIKALVGGRDFYADQFNIATQGLRQPGSAFKAFTLATAIKQGINPTTLVDCTSPAIFGKSGADLSGYSSDSYEYYGTTGEDATGEGTWRVENFGGADYGIRSIQSAFAVSSNTGFARLIRQVGAQNVVNTAHAMGITSDLEAVDSLTLGTSGVTALEMADAYATFATGGIHRDATAITRIVDRDGNAIYEWQDEPTQALDKDVACASIKVMKTVLTQGTATAAQLYSGQEAAGKTGTSENYRDHWLVAYTPQLSTAVWIGSRQEQELPGLDCCYIWNTFMTAALEGSPVEQFPTAPDPAYNNTYNFQQNETLGSILAEQQAAEEKASKKKKKSSDSDEDEDSDEEDEESDESEEASDEDGDGFDDETGEELVYEEEESEE